MAEKLNHSPESKNENLDLSAEIEKNLQRAEKAAEASAENQPNATEITSKAEAHAISGKEFSAGEKEQPASPTFGTYKALKHDSYKRSMSRVRQRLSGSEKVFSKAIHAKSVEAVSEGIGKTAARPSGILGGGIVAFLGSVVLLYVSTHYGFTYNFFVFFILLAGGFVAGLLLELFIRAFKKPRN